MFKFLVCGILLWQEICMISAKNEFSETKPKISDIPCSGLWSMANNKEDWTNDEKVLAAVAESSNFQARQQVFSMSSTSSRNNFISMTISERCFHSKLSSDYVEINGQSAFKLHLRKLPWNRARRICEQEGGYLAVPQMDSEETEILKMMLADSVDDAWLGIHDQFENGDWVTVLGGSLAKTGWSRWSNLFSNNSDNYNGNQHCARLVTNDDGFVDGGVCELRKSFVCQISTV